MAEPPLCREECARCSRPLPLCYCAHLPSLATRTRVLVLQHPRERPKAVGTARIARLCLPESEIVVGVDFRSHRGVHAALNDAAHPAILLYPGPDAIDLERTPPRGPTTLVVIDGTWHQARAMVRANPALAALPRYSLSPPKPSEYRIRRAPQGDFISTIEAMALALGVLEGDRRRFEAMLSPFRAMVDWQLRFAQQIGHGRVRRARRPGHKLRSRLPDALFEGALVCVAGEANAWPYDRQTRTPPHPHELVHFLAHRVQDASSLDFLLAPRAPLSSSPVTHARLDPIDLERGHTPAQLLSVWSDFLRPDDVICAWGSYTLNLLRREGVRLGEQVLDLRKLVGDFLKRSPGSLEDFVQASALSFRPLGRGRGGERLGMLAVVVDWLVREASSAREAG